MVPVNIDETVHILVACGQVLDLTEILQVVQTQQAQSSFVINLLVAQDSFGHVPLHLLELLDILLDVWTPHR